MSTKRSLKNKISGIRLALIGAEAKHGRMEFYDDIFAVIDAYEKSERRCTTLEWMLEAEGKLIEKALLDKLTEDFNKHVSPTGDGNLPLSPVPKAE